MLHFIAKVHFIYRMPLRLGMIVGALPSFIDYRLDRVVCLQQLHELFAASTKKKCVIAAAGRKTTEEWSCA